MWCVTEANRQTLVDLLIAGGEGGEDLMLREVKLPGKKRAITVGELLRVC